MKLNKVYHMGIPVDDLDRAKDFYTRVLGMEYLGRVGGNPNNPDSFPVHGVAQKLDRLRCGDYDIVLCRPSGSAQSRCRRPGWYSPSGLQRRLGRL
jgi:catechol 2,3-dioxygenase-like lactoylglutathione lyase family enzyme